MRIPSLPVWKIIVSFLLLVSVVIIFSSFYVFNIVKDMDGGQSGKIAMTVVVIGIIITFMSLFTIMAVRLRISRSMNKLIEGISLISDGYFDHRVPAISRDETLDLSNAFNQMAETVSATVHTLFSEKNTLSALLDTMADGVIVTDEGGNITLLNKTAQQIFNLENSEYLGLRLADVIRDFEIIQMASDCVDIEESVQDEIEIPEVRRYLSVTATPIGFGSGGGVLITVHDLTNIRQVENTRKEFVSNVSHELRSPLASVKAMVGTLESGALEDKKAATDFINRIDKDVDRMTSLVSDLLELSRLESGQEDIELEPVELRSLVDDSISMVKSQVLDGPEISSKIFENVEIVGNKQKITQILINLLQNSVKFTPPGGTINVEARPNDGFIKISVLDTGIGIASEHLPHLFERFYKVDKARRDGGTGLGLAIVKHIVQAHGGAVYADSVEGEGSAFHFTMPLLNTANIEKIKT